MILARYFGAHRIVPCLVTPEGIVDCSELKADWGQGFFADDGERRLKNWFKQRSSHKITPGDNLRLAPALMRPANLFRFENNYSSSDAPTPDTAGPPPTPASLSTASWCGAGDTLEFTRIDLDTITIEASVDLAFAVSQACFRLSPEECASHIGGLTMISHIRIREDDPRMTPAFPIHSAVGPCFLTMDEVNNDHPLSLSLRINGIPYREGSVSELILNPLEALCQLSQTTRLLPGDVVSLGTPPCLQGEPMAYRPASGDVIEPEISQLGKQRLAIR